MANETLMEKTQQIRNRLDRASVGPWSQTWNGKFGVKIWDAEGHPIFASIGGSEHSRISEDDPVPQWQKDCDFVREAREDIAWLLDALMATTVTAKAEDRIRNFCDLGHAPIKHRAWECPWCAEKEAHGWQPIATAPKDGTMIIVPGGVAHWHGGAWKTLTAERWPGIVIAWDVQAWMPFPAPPQEQP